AAAAAWPGERPPVETVRFEGGKLSLAANGWSDAQIEQFRSVLRPAGVRVDASEGRLILTRGRSGGATRASTTKRSCLPASPAHAHRRTSSGVRARRASDC